MLKDVEVMQVHHCTKVQRNLSKNSTIIGTDACIHPSPTETLSLPDLHLNIYLYISLYL